MSTVWAAVMKKQKQKWGILVLAGVMFSVVVSSCQTQAPVVKLNGQKYQPQNDEYRLLVEARKARQQGDKDAEQRAWEQLLMQYPQTAFHKEANLRLGMLAFARQAWQKAKERLEKSQVVAMPRGQERTSAVWAYGMALFRLGQFEEALSTLEDIYGVLAEDEKRKTVPIVLEAAQKTGNIASEIRWLTAQLPTLPSAQQEEIKQQLRQKINGRLSIRKLHSVYLQRGENLVFPFTLIALRLARYYCHVRDDAKCKALVQKLLEEIPPTHEHFPLVREMQAHISSVQGKVDPRVIGVIYPKTGRGASIGRWVRNAIALVQRKYPGVQIQEMDSRSRPEVAAKAVDELVFKHKVVAIFGPVFPETSAAAAFRAQQLGVPLLSISIREGLTSIGPYVFRNNLTWSRMGRAMARYAVQQLGHRRFAVMYPERSSGQIQTTAFWQEVERLGGRVVGAESYAPGISDFTEVTERLVGRRHLRFRPDWYKLYRQIHHVRNSVQKNRLYKKLVKQFLPVTDFDAIFLPAEHYLQVATLASSLAHQDIEVKLHYNFWEKQREELYRKRNRPLRFVQLLGTNIWKDMRIFELEPRNIIGSIFCVRYFPKSKEQVVRQFVQEYKSSYAEQTRDSDPIHVSAYAYDSMNLLMHIAARSNPPSSRAAFREALLRVQQFPGVTGDMSVQADGEILAPIKYIIGHRKQYFELHFVAKELIP